MAEKPAPAPRRRSTVWPEMFLALIITVLVGSSEILLEKTDFHEWVAAKTFPLLERVLPERTGLLPVVVVDISSISGGLDMRKPTDRKGLKAAIDALQAAEVLAVGVDVDFSGDRRGWLEREQQDDKGNDKLTYPEFFQHCLDVSREMPVFLGVYRARNEAPPRWLGLAQYQSLAVNLAGAETDKYETLTRVQKELVGPAGGKLPALGYALAQQIKRGDLPAPPLWLEEYLQPLSDSRGQLVNYSMIDKLNSESFVPEDSPVPEKSSVQENSLAKAIPMLKPRLKGRVVLLGAIDKTKEHVALDYFYVPGKERPEDQIAGPFYHASAAYTFAETPLYEFDAPTLIVLDAVLSFFFLAAVWVRALIASRHHVHETLVVVIELATLAAALFALCWIAIYCMRELQVVWLDSILVAIGLFAHYVAAPFVKGTFPGWFRRSGGET